MKTRLTIAVLVLSSVIFASCTNSSTPAREAASTPAASNENASFNKDDYPVFPNADAGADPSVSAEQGGKGFTGEGWETSTAFDLIGDPRAVKGGALRDVLGDFPGTLRTEGPESNTGFNYGVTSMAYESLLGLHTNTMEYIPGLATHWQISPDHMSFRFRLNPNARFSDGTPVTAEDVAASYDFYMDKTLQSPSNQLTYGKLQRPVAESKYLVSVKAKDLNWRNFLYFSNDLKILPAHVLKSLTGEQYLKDYNFKLIPGSGPYTIREQDVVKGKSITARRRPDYWAVNARANVGLYNFDELRFVVVRDPSLAFEMFKKGELDYYPVARAKEWVEDLNFENVQRGLVQKRKIFNNQPQGYVGFAMNMRRAPFDDLRVRKAMALLANRQQWIEKLFFNEYLPLNSYYASSVYENPTNPANPYDPQSALTLLAEAGWKDRDSQGRLVKNGRPLEIEMLYAAKTAETYLTVYQEDLRRVGVTLNLRLVTPETSFKLIMERQFQMVSQGWGTSTFPNPETRFLSKLADEQNNNNIAGVKSSRIDEICAEYDVTFDPMQRVRLIQEVDGIVANQYPYVLTYYGPYTRIAYWEKFGAPAGYLSRIGDVAGTSGGPGIPQMWWIDSAKQAKLEEALKDPSIKLEVGQVENRYWLEFDKKQQVESASRKSN